MRFTLKQLRYYDAALRTGSIAKAAIEMNISQSSITAALDLIEETVGQELFRRVPAKGIQPTDMGQEVGSRIAAFLKQARVFESDLMSMSGNPTGMLHVGCYAPSAPHVLPRLMKIVAEHHAAIRMELIETDLGAMPRLLNEGKIDLALTYRRTLPDAMPFLPLFRARPYALLRENSALSQQPYVTLKDLSQHPMVLLDLPSAMGYFHQIFADQGLALQVAHTTKSSSVLRGLVAAGFGNAILNICSPLDRTGGAGYIARPIKGQVQSPLFGVAYTHAARRSSLVQAMLEICENISTQGMFDDLVLNP
ncbi:LysR family transcriptional regulator [Lutimaribacter sp. EGI FJ00015]|uniref:LysR family transcriptional regulator n=1 Tax=Lutimaribacter degradans TaxID=2945989 RepID=A0ACC5ZYC8_9RHOB|nr:LysR family transcriptional regulator [Lutimaribacter sp. EGI FJ00013]MCM2563312.1 LysR family transcriptional regulator [Lutimaribacter sp. EGI FJ00013]MCO0614365.1 LysR family transcriptional regulator [Lutimaribacter sp. EGI FJ00015]MCO0636034.1 LysR family transcriptional regulator [Lutimaribacter sp. EGI FJ00014]